MKKLRKNYKKLLTLRKYRSIIIAEVNKEVRK